MSKAKNLFPKREYSDIEGSIDICDRIIIRDEEGNEVAVSDCYSPEDWITLEFNNIVFIAPPGYDENSIMISWNSLINFVNNKN